MKPKGGLKEKRSESKKPSKLFHFIIIIIIIIIFGDECTQMEKYKFEAT